MTVPSEVSSVSYSGNGTTTVFAIPFYFLENSHIKVILRSSTGSETTWVINVNYTLTGAGVQAGGTLTATVAPATGTTLVISRSVPATQETDYPANDPFPSSSHERALDKLTMIVQQNSSGIKGAIRVPDTDPEPARLPTVTARSNLLLGFDSSGNPIAVVPASGSAADLALNLANSADASKGSALIGTFQTGSTLGRTQRAKNLEHYTLADFPSIDFTGVTDSTVGVQAAIDYCATNLIDLHTGRGTVLVSGLLGRSNLNMIGPGMGLFTFKRNPAAATGHIFDFNAVTKFSISKFTLDGNKAAAMNGGNNLSIGGACSDYIVEDIESKNANAVSGFGAGIVLTGAAAGTQAGISFIRKCTVKDNEGPGIQNTRVSGLSILDNFVSDNDAVGIDIINFVFPPVADVANDLEISRNRCMRNLQGIRVVGYYRGGTAGALIYGTEIPATRHITISNNHCSFNDEYGIAVQGASAIISNNHIGRNGNSAAFGGALLNSSYAQFCNNQLEDNFFYGIDAGGSIKSVISGNHFIRQGATSAAGSTDINLGAGQECEVFGNYIDQTGVVGACVGIGAPRWDGDGVKFFPTLSQHLMLTNNIIRCNGNAASLGIYLRGGPSQIQIANNRVLGAVTDKDYVIEAQNVLQSANFSNLWGAVTGEIAAGAASAATLVIPDVADMIYVSGATGITRIETFSSNTFLNKIFRVDMTAAGTGYTSAPAVSFTGGGGSGAAGTALLGSDGTIIGVEITAPGTGYTSAPTVGFTGGGGSGAAGTAVVGCYNFANRQIRLVFQGTLTVTDGGNLAIAGNFSAVAGSILTLVGYAGAWSEISRAI